MFIYYTMDNQSNQNELILEYLKSLSDKDKKGYEIAKSHLGMSFQIEKSVGFIKYIKSKQTR